MTFFSKIAKITVVSTLGLGITSYIYRGNIKTYFRLQQKINLELPKDYKKRRLEDDISKVVKRVGSQGVYVLYAPELTGKTTAIKKVLKEIQDSNAKEEVTLYDWNNNNKPYLETFSLKPVYIDVSKEPNINWFDQFGSNRFGDITPTIPKNTKTIVVLDNMSKEVLDGFDEISSNKINKNCKAIGFYSYHAVNSYNTGLKYVVIVVTNDKEYATNILRANGCIKVHQIKTEYDENCDLHKEAMQKERDYMQMHVKNVEQNTN